MWEIDSVVVAIPGFLRSLRRDARSPSGRVAADRRGLSERVARAESLFEGLRDGERDRRRAHWISDTLNRQERFP